MWKTFPQVKLDEVTAHLLEWFSRSCWRTATSYHDKASATLTCTVTCFLSSHWYFSAFIRIPAPLWNMHTMISSPKLCSSHLFHSVDFILISLSSTAKRFCTSPITVTSELWILSYCVVVTAVNTFALNVTDLSLRPVLVPVLDKWEGCTRKGIWCKICAKANMRIHPLWWQNRSRHTCYYAVTSSL